MTGRLARASSWVPGLTWAGTAAASCAWMAPLEPNLLEEGFLIHAAQRLGDGEHLYRDIASFTGPLPFELLALLLRIFGEEIAVGRWLVVGLTAVACACTFSWVRRSTGGPVAHGAAACVAAAPVLLFPLLSIFFYSTLAFYGSLIATYAAVRAVNSARWALGTGVLVACVALCKQNLGLALAVGLALGMIGASAGLRRRRIILAFAAGGASVTLLTLLVFTLRGDLAVFVRSLVLIPLSLGQTFRTPFINLWPLGEFVPELRTVQLYYLPQVYNLLGGSGTDAPEKWVVAVSQLLYGLPFLAFACTAVHRLFGPLRPFLWIQTGLLLALTSSLFPRTDWGHLVFVLPVAAIQLLLVTGRAPHPASSGSRLATAGVVGLVVVLAASVGFVGHRLHAVAGPASFGPRVPQRPVSAVYRSSTVPRVIDFLRDRLQPGEAIFVARAEPLLYFATGASNPTPFGGVIPGFRQEQERRILPALEHIRYVVMSEIDQPLLTYYASELPAVQAELERHFRIPAEFLDGRPSWLLVLERGPDRGASAIDLIEERPGARAWVRDRRGRRLPSTVPLPRTATRHNRRPLAIVLGARGGGIDFDIRIPPAAVFQAGVWPRALFATLADASDPARGGLQLSIRRADRFEPLQLRATGPGPPGGYGWIPVEADLAAYAGQNVALRLETPDAALVPGALPLAWWGSPRIVIRPASE